MRINEFRVVVIVFAYNIYIINDDMICYDDGIGVNGAQNPTFTVSMTSI